MAVLRTKAPSNTAESEPILKAMLLRARLLYQFLFGRIIIFSK